MKTIQVLGTGCAKCMQLHDNAKKAAEQLQVPYTIEKVTDLQKIMMMGVLSTPALAVDGKVIVSGRVPDVEAIKVMLG